MFKRNNGRKVRSVKTFEEIKSQIEPLKGDLHRIYGVSRIEIFGSYARGEQLEESDLDVLVDFDRPVSLLDVAGLEIFLSEQLHTKVDVVLRRSVRPELREIIFNEAVPI